MKNTLRQLVRDYDKANARSHRLTGEPVLAARGDARTRRICISCRRDADPQLHREKWLAQYPLPTDHRCLAGTDSCVEWGWCLLRYVEQCMPLMTVCPACGGELHEVTLP